MRAPILCLTILAGLSTLGATPPATPRAESVPSLPQPEDRWVREGEGWRLEAWGREYSLSLPGDVHLEGGEGGETGKGLVREGTPAFEALLDARRQARGLEPPEGGTDGEEGGWPGVRRFLLETAWAEGGEVRALPVLRLEAPAPVAVQADPPAPASAGGGAASVPSAAMPAPEASAPAGACVLEAGEATLVATGRHFTVHLPDGRMLYGGALDLGPEWGLHPSGWEKALAGREPDQEALAALRKGASAWLRGAEPRSAPVPWVKAFLAQTEWAQDIMDGDAPAASTVCLPCGLTFANARSRARHMGIHGRKAPHVCPHKGCGAAFSDRKKLAAHQAAHAHGCLWPCRVCMDLGVDPALLERRAQALKQALKHESQGAVVRLVENRGATVEEALKGRPPVQNAAPVEAQAPSPVVPPRDTVLQVLARPLREAPASLDLAAALRRAEALVLTDVHHRDIAAKLQSLANILAQVASLDRSPRSAAEAPALGTGLAGLLEGRQRLYRLWRDAGSGNAEFREGCAKVIWAMDVGLRTYLGDPLPLEPPER